MIQKVLIMLVMFVASVCFVDAEEIVYMDVDLSINADATVHVTETILYDFGLEQKHGIYRDIPVSYVNSVGDSRTVQIQDLSVKNGEGVVYMFEKEHKGKNMHIQIGNADQFVTGQKMYVITYVVRGAINYFDDHDELYWNVVGGQWTVPIDQVKIVVHAKRIDHIVCFFGQYGSTNACNDTWLTDDRAEAHFVQQSIMPGDYLTTVIGMPVGTVHKPTKMEKIIMYVRDNWILGMPFVIFCGMWRLWYVRGRDPKGKGTIVPYYEAPRELSVLHIGMMTHGMVKQDVVSAAIIQLAVEGYLKIHKIDKDGVFGKDDYEFMRTQKDTSDLDVPEKLLLESIFGGTQTKKMTELKDKFYIDLEKIKKSVEESIMQKKYYTKNPMSVRAFYIALGAILFFGAFWLGSVFGLSYAVATMLSALSIVGFGFFMPQPTTEGAILREEIQGLKLYLETAEKDRLNFHNAPEKRPERFEALLPYAMVLGVEDAWAKQFEDIYNTKPQWYQSSDPSFSPIFFVSSMHAFSNTGNATMFSHPSSAGSGGSGFSGGGGGGGFGGGGGGSW